MSINQPVLVSIKGKWENIAERPIVGKDVLELLSSSMYVNPLSIYREYVQNAADSIEEAIALGLLLREDGRIEIKIDPDSRVVRIRDNGVGVSKSAFERTLVALGASRKRGTKARGFRGVGRLAGLGYCQELTFRSKSDGERQISEMRWDCRRLKSILRDPSFKGDVEELIREVVKVYRCAADDVNGHFFEVELSGIVRHGDDRLVNADSIRDYLSQVAPVPFSPSFRFAEEIERVLHEEVSLGNVRIYLNDEDKPLFRPHLDQFEARKGVTDRFVDVRFFEIKGKEGELAAKGWVLDHGYFGAIDTSESIKGLRLRSGNMQVGELDVLDELFTEARFNSWAVGEIHVLDQRILPNGRRDHFEQNTHFSNLLGQLRPIAQDLSRRCRQSSIRRNVIRQFDSSVERVRESTAIVRQGVVGSRELKRIVAETKIQLEQMEKACSHSALNDKDKSELQKKLRNAISGWEKAPASQREHKAFSRIGAKDKEIIERVFALVYACSPNKQSAKTLIDQILRRL